MLSPFTIAFHFKPLVGVKLISEINKVKKYLNYLINPQISYNRITHVDGKK